MLPAEPSFRKFIATTNKLTTPNIIPNHIFS